jgi:hypothetical protein
MIDEENGSGLKLDEKDPPCQVYYSLEQGWNGGAAMSVPHSNQDKNRQVF